MPDDLTATLEQIKADAEGWIIDNDGDCSEVGVSCIGHNTRRAVAALEAVLKLADEAEPVERDYGGEPIWWSLKPADVREAVTRALTGDADA